MVSECFNVRNNVCKEETTVNQEILCKGTPNNSTESRKILAHTNHLLLHLSNEHGGYESADVNK